MAQYALFEDGNPIAYTIYGPDEIEKVDVKPYVTNNQTWILTAFKNRFNLHYDFMTDKWVKNKKGTPDPHLKCEKKTVSMKSNKQYKTEGDHAFRKLLHIK